MDIKKDDKVMVLSGKDKGAVGKVLHVVPKNDKVVVEGVNMHSKHQKARKQGEESGIVRVETPLHACKVQLVCPKCGKPTRIGHEVNGKNKIRICRKCGAEI